MKRRLRIGVVFGGQSGEHEVSLASARSIMSVLHPDKYDIVPIGITHSGRWLVGGDPMAVLAAGGPVEERGPNPQEHESREEAGQANTLVSRPTNRGGRDLVPGATGGAFPQVDVIFPVLHGPYGEDGTIQGLLELAGVPYVGCGVLASSLGMDKIASKRVFVAQGLPVVPFREVKRKDWQENPERVILDLEAALDYPLFVKPANLGSSIGISKALGRDQLLTALAEAARYDRKLIVEEAIPAAREIECSVLGNDDPISSSPGEVIPCNEFYDYSAKYLDDLSQIVIPAPIAAEVAARVRDLAVQAFKALDCAGLARVDFLMSGVTGELFLNELNTMPGFTAISMYPKLWEASGLPYAELVDRLVELALERHADQACSLTTFSGAMSAG